MLNADGEFVRRITKGEDIHKVYREVYGTESSKASALMRTPEVKEAITETLKAQGVTIQKLNKALGKQLDAKKVIYYDPKLSREEVPDNIAINNAINTGYKLYGVLKDKDVVIDNRQVTFSGDTDKLIDIIHEMKALRDKAAIDVDGKVC